MTGGVGRVLLTASVGPLAASVIVSRFGEALEETARNFEVVGTPEALQAARQLRRALAEMRESARLRNLARAEAGSVDRTAERLAAATRAESESPPWSHWMTVSAVAERLKVSESYIRRKCRGGGLPATKPGREWRIESAVVADLESARSIE